MTYSYGENSKILKALHLNPLAWLDEQRRLIRKRYGFDPTEEQMIRAVKDYQQGIVHTSLRCRLKGIFPEACHLILTAFEDKKSKEREEAAKREEALGKIKKLH
jgi:hypothetical protein